MGKHECNVCGGDRFADMGTRRNVRCVACGSLERTRVMQLMLDKHQLVKPGMRIMHIAPERGIYERIRQTPDLRYEVYDLFPDLYRFAKVERLDLATECESIPSSTYDLIIHSHVMEHIPCDVSAVFFHLQRGLRESGKHVFCVPILAGHWDSCFGGIEDSDRVRRFGQADHVRRFGLADLQQTLGMLFPFSADYDLGHEFSQETLDKYNIPEAARRGYSSSSVFVMGKRDFKLQSI